MNKFFGSRVIQAALLTGILALLAVFLEPKSDPRAEVKNATLTDSPIIVDSPGAIVSIVSDKNKINSIYLEASLSGVKGEEVAPSEVDFEPVGSGSDAFLESDAGSKIYLDFQSPVIFSYQGDMVTIKNNFVLRPGSVIQGQPLGEIKNFNKLKVPIITVVYGKSMQTMKNLSVVLKINGENALNQDWKYNDPFQRGPQFTIPLAW